ncbi:MAG: RHS repeat-associated core domain-containing protein [Planctomycetaceae bacterium]|nr:RHS repeat-associated core domain-containing protein [Planctomycetaceae bacterium]
MKLPPGDSGTAQVFAYDAYGVPIGFTLANALTTLLYSGEMTDQLTGLQYLRARYYNPATGTFNRLDPFKGNFRDPQSLHKYLYTHADPVNGIDPSGMMNMVSMVSAITIGAVVTAFAAGATVGAKTRVESDFWWEGFIPGWGSGRGFGANMAQERYGWAALNFAFGILDVFVVSSFFRNIAKGIAQGGLRSLFRPGTVTPAVGAVDGTGPFAKHLAYKVVTWGSNQMRRFHGTICDGMMKFSPKAKNSRHLKGFLDRFLRGDSTGWTRVIEIADDGTRQGKHFANKWWPEAKQLTVMRIPVLSTEMASFTNHRAITCVGAWLTAVDRGLLGGPRVFIMVMTDEIASLGELEGDLDTGNL